MELSTACYKTRNNPILCRSNVDSISWEEEILDLEIDQRSTISDQIKQKEKTQMKDKSEQGEKVVNERKLKKEVREGRKQK